MIQNAGHIGILRTQRLLEHRLGLCKEGFCFLIATERLVEKAQTTEATSSVRMGWAVCLFKDGPTPLKKRFCFSILSLIQADDCKITHDVAGFWMLWTIGFFAKRQSALGKIFS